MIVNMLNLIRSNLKKAFPEVARIYVNDIPSDFVRPSFLVDLIFTNSSDNTSELVTQTASWQIIYYAEEYPSGKESKIKLMQVLGQVLSVFRHPAMAGADGHYFDITNLNGEVKDDNVFFKISFETQMRRSAEQHDFIETVEIKGV